MDYVELAKAIAVPIAVIISALTIAFVAILVAFGKIELNIRVKEWFELGARSKPHDGSKADPDLIGDTTPAETPKQKDIDNDEIAQSDIEISESNIETLVSAKDYQTLEREFNLFRNETTYASATEFWESWYVNKSSELQGVDGVKPLLDLAQKNTDWAIPLVLISRIQTRIGQVAEARATLEQAFARGGSQLEIVLSELIQFYSRHDSIEKSYNFVWERIQAGYSPGHIATLLGALQKEEAVKGDAFSSIMIREFILRFDPNASAHRFQIAHEASDHEDLSILSYEHYEELIKHYEPSADTYNNIGVIYGRLDLEATRYDYYKKALEKGSQTAASNLIQSLISDNFLVFAEEIAKNAPIGSDENKNFMSAKNALMDARTDEERAVSEIRAEWDKDYRSYLRAVREALAFWQKTGDRWLKGQFSNPEGLMLTCKSDEAICEFVIGSISYSGSLSPKPFCYEGWAQPSKHGAEKRRIMVTASVNGNSLVTVWPVNAKEGKLTLLEGLRINEGK